MRKTCKTCGADISKNPYSTYCYTHALEKQREQQKKNVVKQRSRQSGKKKQQKIQQTRGNTGAKQCAAYRNTLLDKYGFLFCEECGVNATYSTIEIHHIVYRSEKPKHKYLHNKRNLISVCGPCHTHLHSNKKHRKQLVEDRRLQELFDCTL